MKMNNDTNLNEKYFVDIELLRLEKLIEEREAYEEQFFSSAPTNDDISHLITEYEREIENQMVTYTINDSEYEIVNPFEYEDHLMKLRDENLIKEREEYESSYFKIALDEFAVNDIYDFQIAAREEEEFIEMEQYDYEPEDYWDYEYDQYEEDMFWNLYYLRQSQLEKPKCGCAYMDYMPHDDGFCDYLECYDYPEGPDENLDGVKYY